MAVKVIIVGAGAYGLSAGSYLAMNGFDVDIFEMNTMPGGVCTAWQRGGYTFDGCIHWLMGSSPGTRLHELWRELHAVQGRRFVEWEEYVRIRTSSGEVLTVFTDPTRLEREMLRIAPDDSRAIRGLCSGIARMSRLDFPVAMEKMTIRERIRALLALPSFGLAMARGASASVETFCAGLKSRALAEALRCMYGLESAETGMADFPIAGLTMMLGFMHKKSNGYPIGGSLEFARAIERRFCELGGTIHYGRRVDRILVENDQAVGIACGPEEHRADVVISCADGHATLFGMLGGRYLGPSQREAYDTYPVFPSLIYVGIGIEKDLRDKPSMTLFPLKKEITLEDGALTLRRLGVRLFNFDPTMAPARKTAATVMIATRNHAYWTSLREKEPEKYRCEKNRIGELVVRALDEELGDIEGHVEVIDVATPATWIRCTGNWQGSYEGFLPTRKSLMKSPGFALPGLRRFYMSSQWVSVGGGLPPAAMSGRALARTICREFGRTFRALD